MGKHTRMVVRVAYYDSCTFYICVGDPVYYPVRICIPNSLRDIPHGDLLHAGRDGHDQIRYKIDTFDDVELVIYKWFLVFIRF